MSKARLTLHTNLNRLHTILLWSQNGTVTYLHVWWERPGGETVTVLSHNKGVYTVQMLLRFLI